LTTGVSVSNILSSSPTLRQNKLESLYLNKFLKASLLFAKRLGTEKRAGPPKGLNSLWIDYQILDYSKNGMAKHSSLISFKTSATGVSNKHYLNITDAVAN
jgi:hypothetical protein